MRHSKLVLLPGLLIILIAAFFMKAGPAHAAFKSISITCGQWNVVSSPNNGTYGSVLNGVTAISSTDAWSVGYYDTSTLENQTLTEQWNGTAWNIVASPDPSGNTGSSLYGIAAIAANNVWTVGYYFNSSGVFTTLIEEWNGTKWSIVSSPNRGTDGSTLTGISAISATNIWAVGQSFSGSTASTLVEHYNGTKWSIVSSPNVEGQSSLFTSVKAVASTNVWAVGESYNAQYASQTLTEHYNGTKWSIVASPNPQTSANYLEGVAAASSKSVWTVGGDAGSNGRSQTLVEKWNGSLWSVIPSPNPSSSVLDQLNSITVVGTKNIWAAGIQEDSSGNTLTLTENWNGTKWIVVVSPNPSSYYSYLNGIGNVPGTKNVWTVGDTFSPGNPDQTLIEEYC